MAKKKNFWYIIVFTYEGPKFVTGIPSHNTAEWDKLKPPMEFSKVCAEDTAWALRLNGFWAFATPVTFELTEQPYRYSMGQFRWETNGNDLNSIVNWIAEHPQVFEDFKARFPEIAERIEENENET